MEAFEAIEAEAESLLGGGAILCNPPRQAAVVWEEIRGFQKVNQLQ